MQVFTTDKKNYRVNELKSWVLTGAVALLVYTCFRLFSSIPEESIYAGITAIFFGKLGKFLTQYHVIAIQLSKETGQLNFILNSIMTGAKNKLYDLQQISSEITEKKTWTNAFKPSCSLKIYATKKETFEITSRYGFTVETLNTLNNALKS